MPPISATQPGHGEPAPERHEARRRLVRRPCVAHLRPLLAVLQPRADEREDEDRRRSARRRARVPPSAAWTTAHSANAHIIGCRVIRWTPRGAARAAAAGVPISAGFGVATEPTNRIIANSMTTAASGHAHAGAVHRDRPARAATPTPPSRAWRRRRANRRRRNRPRRVAHQRRAERVRQQEMRADEGDEGDDEEVMSASAISPRRPRDPKRPITKNLECATPHNNSL